MRKLLFVYFVFLIAYQLPAQVDTVLMLPTVNVTDETPDFATGVITKINTNQSFTLTQNLAQVLSGNTALNIKNYSPGGLATISVHGNSPAHTKILWNGFDIRSPLNGNLDLSLLQGGLFDEIRLNTSGAIGGQIELINHSSPLSGWHGKAGFSAKDYHHNNTFGQLYFQGKKLFSDLRLSTNFGQNDYSFFQNNKKTKQQNSAINLWSIAQTNTYHVADNQQIKTFFLYNTAHREIAPAKNVVPRHEQQNDTGLRMGAGWLRQGTSVATTLKLAYFDENLTFQSELFDPVKSRAQSWLTDATFTGKFWQVFPFQFIAGYTHTRGFHPSFRGDKLRNTFHFSGKVDQFYLHEKKLKTTEKITVDIIDGKIIPLSWQTGVRLRFKERHILELNLEKNVNTPTFNDLYWEDAFAKGNPNLKTETAKKISLHHQFKLKTKNTTWTTTVNLFSNSVQNRIAWIPIEGIWQPHNIRSVWSRGVDASFHFGKNIQDIAISNTTTYSYSPTTVTRRYDNDNLSHTGAQLFYVPIHTLHESLSFKYGQFTFFYHQNIFGKRYTTSDNNEDEALPVYSVGNLRLQYQWHVHATKIHAHFGIDNLWNVDYEVIKGWAMPVRSFEVGAIVSF